MGCRSRSRGRALYRDALRAANVLGPSPSKGGDLELEGGVNVSCENMAEYIEHLLGLASECRC